MAQVLIIDDSPTEVHYLTEQLEKHGHFVVSSPNGEEGVRKAKLIKPDIILMDVVMPGVNGFQATRLLKKDPATADIPVIMATTKDQDTDRMWAMKQGASNYLTKPISESSLIAAINDICGIED